MGGSVGARPTPDISVWGIEHIKYCSVAPRPVSLRDRLLSRAPCCFVSVHIPRFTIHIPSSPFTSPIRHSYSFVFITTGTRLASLTNLVIPDMTSFII